MGKDTPKAPDPYETAAAQAGMNRDTALTQAQLGTGTQNNPWGSVSYTQGADRTFTDSQGNVVTTPTYTQNTTLTRPQQKIFNQGQAAELNLAELANDQSSFLQGYLDKPFKYNNQKAENWAYDLGAQRLDPRMEQQRAATETRLANQGIAPGSRAWETAMAQQGETQNDAYNQLMLNGRQMAFSEALAQRNQPLNEISALMSGSQVSNPATMGAAPMATPGVGGVDYSGLVGQKFAADTSAYQNKLGGLFGLGAAGITAFSDRRLKKNVRQIGTVSGLPWYQFNYKWDGPAADLRQGFMSDDVRAVKPNAVDIDPASGYDVVRYDLAME